MGSFLFMLLISADVIEVENNLHLISFLQQLTISLA